MGHYNKTLLFIHTSFTLRGKVTRLKQREINYIYVQLNNK